MKVPRVLKNSAIYSIVMILQKGISFFLLPIYTTFLSPNDYGLLSVVTSVTSFLAIFITLGLDTAAQRFYYKNRDDKEYPERLYGNAACSILCSSLLLGSIFIVGHKWIINPILGNIDFYPCVFLGIINVILTPLYLLYQSYLQTTQDGLKYGVNALTNFILNVVLIIVFLTIFDWGVLGILLANIIVSFLFLIYVVFIFLKRIRFGFDRIILKDSLKYSLPMLPHALFNWSNGTIDKLLVNGLRSQSDAGLYNMGQQYGTVMNLSANAINQAYIPWFFDKMNNGKDGVSQIVKIASVAVAFLSLVALVLSLFSKEVLDLMISNPAYANVWIVVPFIVFSYVYQGIYFFFVNVLLLKHTSVIFIVTMVSVIGNIIFNLLLIPLFGFMGSAIACLITYFLKSLFALFVSRVKNKEIRFHSSEMYLLSFLSLGVVITTIYCLQNTFWYYALFIKFAVIAIFSGLLILRYKKYIYLLRCIYGKKKTI